VNNVAEGTVYSFIILRNVNISHNQQLAETSNNKLQTTENPTFIIETHINTQVQRVEVKDVFQSSASEGIEMNINWSELACMV